MRGLAMREDANLRFRGVWDPHWPVPRTKMLQARLKLLLEMFGCAEVAPRLYALMRETVA